VVAFELLTGARPFERESSTAEALAHVSAPIPPASLLNPDLPPQLDDALARGLAKEPEHRYDSAADLVHALRDALDDAAGGTTVGALAPVIQGGARRWLMPLVALGILLLIAGVVAAALVAGDDPKEAVTTKPQTVKETVTLPATTVVQTVTTEAAPTTAPETAAPAGNPSDLNNQGFELMKAGNYEAALPLLEQAVSGLSGSGGTAEAYASYNLAFTRLALGRCDGVADLLDRSEQIQGKRKEISSLRHEAKKNCEGER
jgi:tetratricopeptide (TPR) repeat protein